MNPPGLGDVPAPMNLPTFPALDDEDLAASLHNLCVRLLERIGTRPPESLTGLVMPTSRGIELGIANADDNLRALRGLDLFARGEGARCIEELRSPRRADHLRVLFVGPKRWLVFDCPVGLGPKE